MRQLVLGVLVTALAGSALASEGVYFRVDPRMIDASPVGEEEKGEVGEIAFSGRTDLGYAEAWDLTVALDGGDASDRLEMTGDLPERVSSTSNGRSIVLSGRTGGGSYGPFEFVRVSPDGSRSGSRTVGVTVAPPEEVLSVDLDDASATSIGRTGRWAVPFSVRGGAAPYSVRSVSNLPSGVEATIREGVLELTGKTDVGEYADIVVTVEDVVGTTFSAAAVGVDVSSPALASTRIPTNIGSAGATVVRAFASQTLVGTVFDGRSDTGLTIQPGRQNGVTFLYAEPVEFDQVFVEAVGAFDIVSHDGKGGRTVIHSGRADGSRLVDLGRSRVTGHVGIEARDTSLVLREFRPGGSGAATPPRHAGPVTVAASRGDTVISAADFVDMSGYFGDIRLRDMTGNGVLEPVAPDRGSEYATSFRLRSDITADVPVRLRAHSAYSQEVFQEIVLTVTPKVVQRMASDTDPVNMGSGNALPFRGSSANFHVLKDRNVQTGWTINGTNGDLRMIYASDVSLSEIYLDVTGSFEIVTYNVHGVASTHGRKYLAGTELYQLGRMVTARQVGIRSTSGSVTVREFRPGNR